MLQPKGMPECRASTWSDYLMPSCLKTVVGTAVKTYIPAGVPMYEGEQIAIWEEGKRHVLNTWFVNPNNQLHRANEWNLHEDRIVF